MVVLDSLPSEVASPLCEVDGDWDVTNKGDEDDDGNPGLQRSGQVDTGRRNVKDLGPNVEDDGGQDALDGVCASVHDAHHLACLSVQVKVEVQVQGMYKYIEADAPAVPQPEL